MDEKNKKMLKFDNFHVYWYYKSQVENEEELQLLQDALDELQFHNRLEGVLNAKL